MSEKCCAVEQEGCCCCRCAFQAVDVSHPCTDGGRISQQRGWVCTAPEFYEDRGGLRYDVVVSGWSEHGLCEMFTERELAWRLDRSYLDTLTRRSLA